jgi:hypothetical protein
MIIDHPKGPPFFLKDLTKGNTGQTKTHHKVIYHVTKIKNAAS